MIYKKWEGIIKNKNRFVMGLSIVCKKKIPLVLLRDDGVKYGLFFNSLKKNCKYFELIIMVHIKQNLAYPVLNLGIN